MHYTIMAASFAYLKPFLSAFNSDLGATVKLDTVMNTSGPSGGYAGGRQISNQLNSGGSYSMKPLSHNHSQSRGHSQTRAAGIVTSQTAAEQMRREREERRRRGDSNSQDSNAPIILKTQTYEVRTEQMGNGNGRMI